MSLPERLSGSTRCSRPFRRTTARSCWTPTSALPTRGSPQTSGSSFFRTTSRDQKYKNNFLRISSKLVILCGSSSCGPQGRAIAIYPRGCGFDSCHMLAFLSSLYMSQQCNLKQSELSEVVYF